jgi:hypothetical protein
VLARSLAAARARSPPSPFFFAQDDSAIAPNPFASVNVSVGGESVRAREKHPAAPFPSPRPLALQANIYSFGVPAASAPFAFGDQGHTHRPPEAPTQEVRHRQMNNKPSWMTK